MRKFLTPLILLLTGVLAVSVFLLSYRYDNKYTAVGPRARNGVLKLSENTLERLPFVYLIGGWKIYRGKLLAPEDLKERWTPPDEYVFIGQYGGFEGRDKTAAPHGSATYRLTIFLPSEIRSYTLELPEIYSAYKLYINGRLCTQMGEPDAAGYHPQTGNRTVTVQAAERMEILIAVSDYSHFYSGMVYPSAFGEPETVEKLIHTRLSVRLIACTSAACLGLLYLGVCLLTGGGKKRRDALYYGALCFCFILYTGYPVVKTLGYGGMCWYTLENFAFCAMLLLTMLIQRRLTGSRWWKPFAVFACLVCCCALTAPLWVRGGLNLMAVYSQLIELYYWVCALYLTFGAVYGVMCGRMYGKIMRAGNIVFDAALIMSRILPIYEPIRFGWFTELAGAVMVLFTGFVLARDVAERYRLSWAMESRMETVSRMLDVQRAYYPKLLEREEKIETVRHDLRHHILVIRQFIAQGGGEKLETYLNDLESRQTAAKPVFYCKHYLVNTLLELYASLAGGQETEFVVSADLPEAVSVKDADLSVILSNLLENALDATSKLSAERRKISVTIGLDFEMLGIIVQNPFDGYVHMENGRFLSVKKTGREGVGLISVRSVCQSYGGNADFYTSDGNIFHGEVCCRCVRRARCSDADCYMRGRTRGRSRVKERIDPLSGFQSDSG